MPCENNASRHRLIPVPSVKIKYPQPRKAMTTYIMLPMLCIMGISILENAFALLDTAYRWSLSSFIFAVDSSS